MHKNIVHWFWCLSACAAVCLIGLMAYPSIVYTDIFAVICAYIVIDAFAFFVGYGILQKFSLLTFWKFALYLAALVGASVAINFLLPEAASHFMMLFILLVFAILVSLNVVLWRTMFALTVRQAYLISLILGLVNAFVCIAATPICH